jgi:hypothetical protein
LARFLPERSEGGAKSVTKGKLDLDGIKAGKTGRGVCGG